MQAPQEDTEPTFNQDSSELESLPEIPYTSTVEHNNEEGSEYGSNIIPTPDRNSNVQIQSSSSQRSNVPPSADPVPPKKYFKTYDKIQGTTVTHDFAILELTLEVMTGEQVHLLVCTRRISNELVSKCSGSTGKCELYGNSQDHKRSISILFSKYRDQGNIQKD